MLEYSNSTISLMHALVMAILNSCYSSYIHYLAFVTTDWCECIPACSIPMPMYNMVVCWCHKHQLLGNNNSL